LHTGQQGPKEQAGELTWPQLFEPPAQHKGSNAVG
jgi:hypothetical protein